MSYILEALKKSQRDRELGQVPDLATETYAEPSDDSRGLNPWIIIAISLALIAVLIALYGVFSGQLFNGKDQPDSTLASPKIAKIPAPTTKPVQAQAVTQTTASANPQPTPTETVAKIKPSPPKLATAERPKAPPAVVKQPPPRPAIQQKPTAQVDPTSVRQTEVDKIRQEYNQMQAHERQDRQHRVPQKELTKEKGAAGAVLKPHQLPSDIQTRLPPRNIMLQFYSKTPSERFVILNSTKLFQGEETTDGIIVIEIREDGLLLEFEGHKFFQSR